jgi:hypothetical protein
MISALRKEQCDMTLKMQNLGIMRHIVEVSIAMQQSGTCLCSNGCTHNSQEQCSVIDPHWTNISRRPKIAPGP